MEHLVYEELLFHERHFTLCIRALARRSLWPQALRLLPEMRHRQLEPNVLSFNVAMDACQKAHEWQRAISLWQDIYLSLSFLINLFDMISFNVYVYSITVQRLMWSHMIMILM